jgi:DNA-binding winged helix-turn-helix (wHTH) protein/tetratricopeptide (TPR) repeat protein
MDGISYSFGSFHLDSDGNLRRGTVPVHIPPKELAALRLLLNHAGKVLTPIDLRNAVWGDVHVTADSVPKCLSSLRALLEPEDCIQTVYKRGYRFPAELLAPEPEASVRIPRIAILPFAVEFGVPEHLGGHVAEEAMIRLAQVRPALAAVVARDSVFTLARNGMTAQQVGEAVKADLALAGTIRALPGHFRFRAELIRIADGTQVWVEDMFVERAHPEALETELAHQLIFRLSSTASGAAGLSIAASASTASGLQNSSPQRREAYEIYQRAHFEWQTLQRHRMQDGLQHLLRATELDPTLIEAWVDLVNLCVAQELCGFMSPSVASEITRRAVAQIPNVEMRAEKMLPALGWMEFHVNHDLGAALRLYGISSHLPHDPWITRCRMMLSLSRHRFDEGIELLSGAIRQDPYSPWLQARLAWALHLKGDASASVNQIRHALELFPDQDPPELYGALILAHNGETRQAIDMAGNLTRRLPYFDLATAVHAYALAVAGERDEAHMILERLQWLSHERFVISSLTPAVWVALGDKEAALASLRTAEKTHCPWFFQMLADPRLKPLEDTEEMQRMRRMLAQMEDDTDYD